MRAIELKTIVLKTFYRVPVEGVVVDVDEDVEYDPVTMLRQTFDYRVNIKNIMSSPPQTGTPGHDFADLDSIRKSVVILTALKKTKEGQPLVLEDDDYNYLVTRLKGARWPFIDEGILTFLDDIEHTVAMSKERIAAAVEKLNANEANGDGAEEVSVRSTDSIPVRPPSLIDAKRNGKSREHARR